MSPRITLACIATALLATASPAAAQARLTGADLEGTVIDETGLPVAGASVVVLSLETNTTRSAQTDPTGRYLIAALPPGRYRVSVSAPQFATHRSDIMTLRVGQLVVVDVTMALATVAEEVNITAAPVVDPTKAAISSVIEGRQIDGLPINGRNFVSFAALVPGVTLAGEIGPGAETSGLSFAGQRPRANNLMVDGFDNNDRVLGGSQASFSQEAIREFQVLTNSFSAEFGQAAGGVVNIVTKSGTNVFSGSGFVFYRDESLNARDHFERVDVFGNAIHREKAPLSQTQWGTTIGGPLRRDRTFFFGSLERQDTQASNYVNIAPEVADVLGANGFHVNLGNVPYDFEATQLFAKVTHQLTPAGFLTLSGHLSDVLNEDFGSFGGTVARSHGVIQLRNDWAVSGSRVDLIGSSSVNELRVQFARQSQTSRALDPRCGGPCLTDMQGGPEVNLPGVALVGRQTNQPTDRINKRIQIKETWSHTRSSHAVKAGVDFMYINQDATLPFTFGGSYTFGPLPAIPGVVPVPLSALEAFSLGLPTLYAQGYGDGTGPFTYKDLAVFVQDDWRVNAQLTLKAGLRYQRQLWPATETTVPSVGGTSLTYPFPQDPDNLAPRVALAFDPTGRGRTSIHGAYGMFFGNQLTTILGSNLVLNGSPDGIRILLMPFPASITAWAAPDHRLPEPDTAFPSTVVTVAPGLESPVSHHASAGISQALGPGLTFTADFVYRHGEHHIGNIDYNPLVPSLGPGRRANDIDGIPGTSASVLQFTDFGETWYKGLLVSLRKRFGQGGEVLASYTLSKAEDNSTSFIALVDDNGRGRDPANASGLPVGFDPSSEKGLGPHDERHRLVLSGIHPLPRDAQLAVVVTAASGRPFTPLAGADLNGDGLPNADRARRSPLDPATRVGRNSERMAGQVTVDVRLTKRFAVGERMSLDGLLDVFNVFNRSNFDAINDVFGVGAFPDEPQRDSLGRVTYGLYQGARSPRQIQLGLKLGF